ncbi:hypothetical protein ACHAQJ_006982 [Trichoderma viride]
MRNYFNYPLVLQARIEDGSIELEFTFYQDALTNGQIEALGNHFEHVMQQLLRQEDVPLKSITISSAWDVQRAIEYNSEEPDIIYSCIHQIIEEKAQKCPDAMAICAWDMELTYKQLNLAADRLSNHLFDNFAVRPNEFIHVCFNKSAWFYISILAINKAGATWVPLDPEHPIKRQQQIVSQTKAKLMLTSPDIASLCTGLVESVLEVSSTLDEMLSARKQDSQGLRPVSPNTAAYVLFTSGSTGTPKGLVMQHRAACTSQTAIVKRLGMASDTRMLQFASYVFDLSIGEILGPWIAGACIYVPSEETRMNGLVEYIRTKNINWIYSTPSFSRTLNPDNLPDLQLLLLAGETVSRDVLETWFGKVRLINGWGPAETCVFSTLHEWKTLEESPSTIGRPVGGFCWIVDSTNSERLAPIGTVGEVVIQGPTLLREYLSDSAKTEEAIVKSLPDWAPNRNLDNWGRLYKSGDLCKYNSDGTIVFVSRKDTQIKIRGLRVELGEVEYQVRTNFEGVNQVVVDKITTEAGSSLVAYFCFNSETKMVTANDLVANGDNTIFLPATNELKGRIAAVIGQLSVKLPRYMIPSFFIPCRYMPSITSTKLDRRMLKRQVELLDPESLSAYSLVQSVKNAPETAMESRLQAMWAKRLNMPTESIGRDDSFLGLGGDSIAVIHFVAEARQAGISLTVKDVFDDPRLWRVAVVANKATTESIPNPKISPFSLLDPGQMNPVIKDELLSQCDLHSWDMIEDAFPCTSLQQGLMAITAKQRGAYVAKMIFKVAKHIDIDQFEASWERTVAICNNLRTRIVQLSSKSSLQVIVNEPALWETTDGLNMDAFLKLANNISMSYGSRLSRFALVRDTNGDQYFVSIMHHSIFDGWSLALMIRTFSAIYHNTTVPRLDLYSSFVRYALRLDLETSEEYWKTQLTGARRAVFPLPRDGIPVTKSEKTTGVSAREISIPSLKKGSITKATYIRAAWAILLARYCDTDDICFGASVSGRNAPLAGVENVLGLVVSTVPIRIRLNPDQLLSEFLHDIQRQSTDMVVHEHFGLQNIAKLSSDAKDVCNFTSLLVIQPKELISEFDGNEALLISTRAEQRLAWQSMADYFNYPLAVQCHLDSDSVDLEFVYDTDIISESQILALHHQFDRIIQQLASTGDEIMMLRDVAIAGSWDLQQATDWNAHEIVIEEHCIHDVISRQAELCPNDEALYATDTSLTYADLERLSDYVAYLLVQHNVQPDTIVPFCMEKSIWAPVAMLGIMKAGGAFMPLDPSHPESRRLAMIEEVNATIIISSPLTAKSCKTMAQNVIEVSASLLSLPHETPIDYRRLNSYKKPGPHDTGYILYTSGSTGKPKGIVMSHLAACTSLLRQPKVLNIGKTSRVLQFSSYVFDVCIVDIFGVLCAGATVCVPTDTERVGNISRFMTEARVTWTNLTPSFVRTIDPSTVPTLKTLAVGGETPTKDILKTWCGQVELLNLYGPAEICVNCSVHAWKSPNESPTTIGRPFSHRLWIVEPDNPNFLTPIGCIGELVIEGPAIARGYVNNEEKTKASFVNDLEWLPSSSVSDGPRVYKSGDLARFNFDGTIEFFGRRDTQTKLRGQRLELTEIEHHVMSKLADVQHAVVDVIEREAGKMLIAFVTFQNYVRTSINPIGNLHDDLIRDEGLTSSFQNLVRSLRETLPSYMIPSVILPLWHMPHNSSQKIDRKILRKLAADMSNETLLNFLVAKKDKTLPTTEMELKLRDLWARVLKVDPEEISKFDNFLEVGGDSITMIFLSNLAAREGMTLPIASIFKDPRLASMAASITFGQVANFATEPYGMVEPATLEATCDTIRQICALSSEQEIEDIFPCTSLQEGLMALSVKQPGSYVAKRVYKLAESVDINHFKASWEQTIQACSNLRTRILMNGETALQTIISNDVSWDEIGEVSLEVYMAEEFEMGYGSRLSRYAIVSELNGSKYFVWTAHHAVVDGWTIQIDLNTLQQIYNKEPKPTLQPYANFIRYIKQLDQDAAARYWLSELEGAQRSVFPPSGPTFESTTPETNATRVLNTQIRFPSLKKSSITKSSILRAAWAIILGRYNDTDDVCFGVTISGRQAPVQGLSHMAGPAVSTVPVRVRLDRTKPISVFLQDVQSQASNMVAYEQFGLQNISKLSAGARDACDVSSLFVIQPKPQVNEVNSLEEAVLTPVSLSNIGVEKILENYFNYPLVMECSLLENHVDLMLVYKANVLTEHQLQGLCCQFELVLSQLLTQQERLLGSVSMTSQWDMDFALASNCDEPVAINECIHKLIEQRAQMHPDSSAICAWDGSFTYAEMDSAANRLAHYLVQRCGVCVGDFVLVCFDKSAWFIIAILAINKSGAAWVPLDRAHPTERYRQIASQTEASLALCSPTSASKCANVVASILEVTPQLDAELVHNSSNEDILTVAVDAQDAAYVLFTSGSTGTPKGVVIQHNALCSSQLAFSKKLGLNVSTRMLQFASYAFDASVAEIIAPFLAGACVCIPSWDTQMNSLATYIQDVNITSAVLTPSFVRTIQPRDVPCLEILVLCGEAVTRDVFEKWVGNLRLFNGWGPTEATVCAALHEWKSVNESHVTIGRPVGAYCWIVDPSNPTELAPTGTLGEIVIQGPGLFREYLSDHERTASAVVASLPGWVPKRDIWSQFYKTGDLAIYNSDGTIRYSSRKDSQVKIRGQRLELGDIEHHISNNMDNVCQVAVDVLKRDAETILTAFICFTDDTLSANITNNATSQDIILPLTSQLTDSINTLLGRLNVVLPTYMVPTLFIPCKAMPLLTSSKLDRKMLLQFVASFGREQLELYSLVHGTKVAPVTDMEHRLQRVWAEILNITLQSIGRDDSFMRIGGDSIAAIRLISALRNCGIELLIGDIFKDPRLLAMASKARYIEESSETTNLIKPFELLNEHQRSALLTHDMKVQLNLSDKMEIKDAFPTTSLQEGLLALSVKQPGSYITSLHYRLAEDVDINKFQLSWEQTVRLCAVLRTRVVHLIESSIQVLVDGDTWDDTNGMTLASYLQSIQEIKVEYGSRLCRYALVQEKKGETYFILTMHHAIFDGWSLRVFFDTLHKVYNGLEAVSLAPYSRFIQYTMNLNSESASSYWKKQLCNAKKALFPPTIGSSTNQLSDPKSVRSMVVNIDLPDARATGITRATILRAAWAVLLARYCDTDDICFGTTISGRQAPVLGIMDIPGPTIATVPLRVHLDRQELVLSFLQSVQEQAIEMVKYEQLGLQNIRKLSSDAQDACDFSSLLVIQPKEALGQTGHREDAILISTDKTLGTGEYAKQDYFSYPLVIQGHLDDESAQLVLIYDSSVIREERIVAVSHQFQHVARELILGMQLNLGAITIASSWDLQQSTIFNSEVPEVIESCFHILVERQARLTPDAMAICAWDGSFTYAELDSAANRLAHHLKAEHAVKLEELIHVCFDKSIWYFVSILAINKAGATWAPLDPTHPLERLHQITRQTNAVIALTSESHATLCGNLLPLVIQVTEFLDQKLSQNDAYSRNAPVTNVSPSNAAYVLFTSGSTGTPKGLVMEHRSVCSSACICVPSEQARINDIAGFIREMDVNWAYLTPSFIRVLTPDEVPNLELLLLCGEITPRDVFHTWVGKVRFISGWGPAETCVFSSLHEWKSATESPLTVGRPVGAFCWIVDPECPEQIAPIGTVGEVMLQGPTLLREYLDDPERTKSSMVTSLPQWAMQKAPQWKRFYKSGDLAMYNHDGTIEFCSRRDTQVKIRGLRVELNEVEYRIRENLEGVCQVAVDILESDGGSTLISYLCFSDETRSLSTPSKSSIDELYMPSITSTKLDRKTLRKMASLLNLDQISAFSLLDSEKRLPETEIQRKFQSLWASILRISADSIGLDDSFLQIGGDSIKVIHLVSKARADGIIISVKDIFDDSRLLAVASKAVLSNGANQIDDHILPFSLLPEMIQHAVIEKAADLCHISASAVEDAFPCTSLQEGLMALSVKQRGSYVAKLHNHIDIGRFREAWNKTVELCDAMRTRIILINNSSIQVLVKDAARWEETNGETLSSLLHSDRGLDMSYGTALCWYALLCEEGTNYFVWSAHHAIYDGWTIQIILSTLDSIYRKAEMPRLQPYNAFIQYSLSIDYDAAANFWGAELRGSRRAAFPPLNAFYDANDSQSTRVHRRTLSLPIKEKSSITKATILRAAWAIILARYCDSDDLTFGTTVSGRQAPVPGLEAMPGLTIATVPVRIRIDNQIKTSDFLFRVQNQATAMISFEQFGIQNIANASIDAKEACNFSSLLVIQPQAFSVKDSNDTILLSGEAERSLTEDTMQSYFNYPLVLIYGISGNTVEQRLFFNPDVLAEQQIIALSYQLEHVIQQLSEDVSLGSISLVGDWDFNHAVNSQQIRSSTQSCIHWLIQDMAHTYPDSLAVSSWDGELTYAELESKASQLAIKLTQLGIGPESLVPLCFPKSISAVITMVAVEMAGGAFVPLDPKVPQARLSSILDDVKATITLTSPCCEACIQNLGVSTLVIDEGFINSLPDIAGPLQPCASPNNAAVVLFTSGSTGRPKGMVIQHDAICSSANAYGHNLQIGPGSRVFQFSAYTFDVGILDTLVTLMRGGCICIPSDYDRLNDLAGAITKSQADWIFLTPTVADLLNPADLPTLRVSGGKTTLNYMVSMAQLKLQYAPGIRRLNDIHKLVPVGCIGELLIQGPMLARGYINASKEQAANWIEGLDTDWLPHDFPRRAYRTGDLVRRNADGTFEYMGRKDTQVKIHSQRVELSEIEAQIHEALPTGMTAIADVVEFKDEEHSRSLLAFLWHTDHTMPTKPSPLELISEVTDKQRALISEIDATLAMTLPLYMIPSSYLILRGKPDHTSSGKVNRQAFIKLAQESSLQARLRFAPGTEERPTPTKPMELKLRNLWAEILHIDVEGISSRDSFLRIGGDSISAIRLVGLAQQYGLTLSVSTIFHNPRLEQMAHAMSANTKDIVDDMQPFSMLSDSPKAVIIQAARDQCSLPHAIVEDAYPSTSLQEGLMTLTIKQPGSYIAKFLYRLRDDIDVASFKFSWARTAEICTSLRTRLIDLNGSAIQVVLKDEITWNSTSEQNLESAVRRQHSITMGYGSNLSLYTLVEQENGNRYFLWTIHHAVFDGISNQNVFRVLQNVYSGILVSPLPPYSRFIRYVNSLNADKAEQYWKTQLQDCKRATFPPQYDAANNSIDATGIVEKVIELPHMSNSNITIATIIRSAWALVLSRYCDSDDICFGTTISGRQAPVPDVMDMVGPTIATVPVRVQFNLEQSITCFLQDVQEQALAMIPFEQLGLQNISKLSEDAKEASNAAHRKRKKQRYASACGSKGG